MSLLHGIISLATAAVLIGFGVTELYDYYSQQECYSYVDPPLTDFYEEVRSKIDEEEEDEDDVVYARKKKRN